MFSEAFVITEPVSIYKGLAFEQVLFSHAERLVSSQEQVFSLCIWRSRPAVVIGRNQDVFEESNLNFLRQENIALARRDSGGGTVYQDEHNLNFCFISSSEHRSVKDNLSFITQVLAKRGLPCTIDEKHNIRYQGAKVSGSAYRYQKGTLMHHCTLLLSSDLDILQRALSPQYESHIHISSVGISSQRTQVTNLHVAYDDIIKDFVSEYHIETSTLRVLSDKELTEAYSSLLPQETQRLQQESWLFGRNPRTDISMIVKGQKFVVHTYKGVIQTISSSQGNILWEGALPLFPHTQYEIMKNNVSDIIKEVVMVLYNNFFGGV